MKENKSFEIPKVQDDANQEKKRIEKFTTIAFSEEDIKNLESAYLEGQPSLDFYILRWVKKLMKEAQEKGLKTISLDDNALYQLYGEYSDAYNATGGSGHKFVFDQIEVKEMLKRVWKKFKAQKIK